MLTMIDDRRNLTCTTMVIVNAMDPKDIVCHVRIIIIEYLVKSVLILIEVSNGHQSMYLLREVSEELTAFCKCIVSNCFALVMLCISVMFYLYQIDEPVLEFIIMVLVAAALSVIALRVSARMIFPSSLPPALQGLKFVSCSTLAVLAT